MDKHEDERQRILRGPQISFPPKITIAVQRALHLPVYAVVRHPLPHGAWNYEYRRIA